MKAKKKFSAIPMILSACLLGIMVSCNNKNSIPDDENILKLPATSSATEIVSYVAQQSYWKHAGGTSVRSIATYSDGQTITYPFKTITINKVTRYTGQPFNVPDKSDTKNITENVKQFKGVNELFVTSFSTEEYGSDILLTFKYETGEYSCVINGSSITEGTEEWEFSSHIQLQKEAINKDMSFPIYEFIVSSSKSQKYKFGYIYRLSKDDPGLSEPEIWFPLDTKNEINANDVYNLDEMLFN
jgi:hypothetical protein